MRVCAEFPELKIIPNVQISLINVSHSQSSATAVVSQLALITSKEQVLLVAPVIVLRKMGGMGGAVLK